MFSKEDVLKLAALSRLYITEGEAEKLSNEMGKILAYVGELTKAPTGEVEDSYHNEINQFREDGEPHQSGLYTEKILAEAPMREGNYIKVKKIL